MVRETWQLSCREWASRTISRLTSMVSGLAMTLRGNLHLEGICGWWLPITQYGQHALSSGNHEHERVVERSQIHATQSRVLRDGSSANCLAHRRSRRQSVSSQERSWKNETSGRRAPPAAERLQSGNYSVKRVDRKFDARPPQKNCESSFP